MTEPAPLERDAQRYRLHGVERALDTLELLAAAGPGGMTLTELADQITVALGGPRSPTASSSSLPPSAR